MSTDKRMEEEEEYSVRDFGAIPLGGTMKARSSKKNRRKKSDKVVSVSAADDELYADDFDAEAEAVHHGTSETSWDDPPPIEGANAPCGSSSELGATLKRRKKKRKQSGNNSEHAGDVSESAASGYESSLPPLTPRERAGSQKGAEASRTPQTNHSFSGTGSLPDIHKRGSSHLPDVGGNATSRLALDL